jgi:hypothetical protein
MDEELKEPEKPKFIWVKPKESTPEMYGNYLHVSWTLFDIRIQVGKLVPTGSELTEFVVEQQGALTVAWPEAKVLRDMLNDVVTRYEKVNGEIKPLVLPPNTPLTDTKE